MTENVLILSIDGGGIRGYIPAIILEAIEKKANGENFIEHEHFRTDNYKPLGGAFDVLGGTSTGGLIALSMAVHIRNYLDNRDNSQYKKEGKPKDTGRQKSMVEISNYYEQRGLEIFTNGFNKGPGYKSSQHNAEGIERFIKDEFGKEVTLEELKNVVGVYAYDLRANRALRLSNRKPKEYGVNIGEYDKMKVWEAARATTAAPTYFPALDIDGRLLIDGGVYINNPALDLYLHAREVFPDAPKYIVISIGTGRYKHDYTSCKESGIYGWFLSGEGDFFKGSGALIEVMMDGMAQAVDAQMRMLERNKDNKLTYIRIQTELHRKIELDNGTSENINFMKEAVRETLYKHEVNQSLWSVEKDIADKLQKC